jgi:hypothetical protein
VPSGVTRGPKPSPLSTTTAAAVIAQITLVPRSPVATAAASRGISKRNEGSPRPKTIHATPALASSTAGIFHHHPSTLVRPQTRKAGVIKAMPNPLARTKRMTSPVSARNGAPSAIGSTRPKSSALSNGGSHAAPTTMARTLRKSSSLASLPRNARTMAAAKAVSPAKAVAPATQKMPGSAE